MKRESPTSISGRGSIVRYLNLVKLDVDITYIEDGIRLVIKNDKGETLINTIIYDTEELYNGIKGELGNFIDLRG